MTKPNGIGLEPWSAEGLGMDHPQVMSVFQASMDAEIAHAGGRTLEETMPQTVNRLKVLFGEDVPVRRVERAMRAVWAPTNPREKR